MTKLEILIVEDNEKNRKTAQRYFNTIKNVDVDFAVYYENGLRKIREGLYGVGIFDLELPKNKKINKLEKLGLGLAIEATEYAIPWAVITAGFFRHENSNGCFVTYSWNEIPDINEIKSELKDRKELDLLGKFGFKFICLEKTDPNVWGKVYQEIIKNTPNIYEITEARKRYKKYAGKPYQLDPKLMKYLITYL